MHLGLQMNALCSLLMASLPTDYLSQLNPVKTAQTLPIALLLPTLLQIYEIQVELIN